MSTYEIKVPAQPEKGWQPVGETHEEAEAAARQAGRDRRSTDARTLVWVRNNFNASVTVFQVDALGHISNLGPYSRFYNTEALPR